MCTRLRETKGSTTATSQDSGRVEKGHMTQPEPMSIQGVLWVKLHLAALLGEDLLTVSKRPIENPLHFLKSFLKLGLSSYRSLIFPIFA